jgi:hypothetical protein
LGAVDEDQALQLRRNFVRQATPDDYLQQAVTLSHFDIWLPEALRAGRTDPGGLTAHKANWPLKPLKGDEIGAEGQ